MTDIYTKGSIRKVLKGGVPLGKPVIVRVGMADEIENPESISGDRKDELQYVFAEGLTEQADGTIVLVSPQPVPRLFDQALEQVLKEFRILMPLYVLIARGGWLYKAIYSETSHVGR